MWYRNGLEIIMCSLWRKTVVFSDMNRRVFIYYCHACRRFDNGFFHSDATLGSKRVILRGVALLIRERLFFNFATITRRQRTRRRPDPDVKRT